MASLAADASWLNPGLQYPENYNKNKPNKTPSPEQLSDKGSSRLKRNTADSDHSLKNL